MKAQNESVKAKSGSASDATRAKAKSRAEAEAVLSCWHDIEDRKFSKKGGGKPKQMTLCSAQRTNSSIPDPEYFVEDHPMPENILAGVPEHVPGGLIGTHEGILRYNRELYKKDHKESVAAVRRLLWLARLAAEEEDAVVTTKTMDPPTGDKRTYMSLATYCWPSNPEDLANPKGPWTCTDGKAFLGRHVIAPDFMMLVQLFNRVYKISMAYYFTGDEYWAERAATKIRKFFLDEETGMLPSLLYAQLKPGMSDVGAPTGTIDMKNVYQLFDSISMLKGSKHWTKEDTEGMQHWMVQYAEYLDTDHVMNERRSINNHGTYFDLQYVSILRYLGRIAEARHYLKTNGKERLQAQIRGSMLPNELVRPKSYAYHNFELEAYVRLALQAEKVNVDLWNFQAEEYNSILDVWDFMGQHWCDRGQTLWPVKQMDNPPLEINRPANFLGALYNKVRVQGVYTQRSLFYAQLFQQFKTGHDPRKEMDWDVAVTSQLPLVKMDDCFMTLCPTNKVLNKDPPSFEAACAPLVQPVKAISAFTVTSKPSTTGTMYSCVLGDDTACLQMLMPLSIFMMVILTIAGFFLFRRGYRFTSVHKRRSLKETSPSGSRSLVRQPLLLKYLRQSESSSASGSPNSGPTTASSAFGSVAYSTQFCQAKVE